MFDLKEQLIKEYGSDLANKICNGYQSKKKTTIRINTIKSSIEEIKKYLIDNNIKFNESSIYPSALILEDCDNDCITNLEIYKNGKIYLQNLSSQLPPLFMELKDNEQILDMAAAPGGKTTEMSAIANVMITACERNKSRYERLKYNISKLGARKINVLQMDSRDLNDDMKFDKILLDAPCSGSGTLNECYLDEKLLSKTIKLQEELFKKAIKLLKKDGILIYSTCSILKEENEKIISKYIGTDFKIIPIDIKDDNIPLLPTEIKGTICLYPNEIYEGFFIAKLKKI